MPFSVKHNFFQEETVTLKQKNLKSSSLPKNMHASPLSAAMAAVSGFLGRAALWASKGSLTVETALVLPFFMFLCMCLIFFIEIFSLHQDIQGSLYRTAQNMAATAPIVQAVKDGAETDAGLLASAVNVTAAQAMALNYIKEETASSRCLLGGAAGLNFLNSEFSEDMIDLIVVYQVRLPYGFGLDLCFPVVQRCRMHTWTGDAGRQAAPEQAEQMVYITKNGVVYHLSIKCTYLKLNIRLVYTETIPNLRNGNGGKYYGCEKCAPNGAKGNLVWITVDGNRYHNAITCSGLKRTVYQVPISEAGDRSACSRCGK